MNCISDLLQNVHTHVFWNVGVAFCSAKLFQECSVRVRSFVVDFEFKVLPEKRPTLPPTADPPTPENHNGQISSRL